MRPWSATATTRRTTSGSVWVAAVPRPRRARRSGEGYGVGDDGRPPARVGGQGQPVSAEESPRAVFAALMANLGVALTKLLAWALTASSSMLAEAIHSFADCGNQGLLLLG